MVGILDDAIRKPKQRELLLSLSYMVSLKPSVSLAVHLLWKYAIP